MEHKVLGRVKIDNAIHVGKLNPLIGGVLSLLWPELDWRHIAIAFALIFVIRPLFGWRSLRGTELKRGERLVVAAYGVRGIESIYYLGYATSHLELVNEGHGFEDRFYSDRRPVHRQDYNATDENWTLRKTLVFDARA